MEENFMTRDGTTKSLKRKNILALERKQRR
jgi:hypothetical protein